MDLGLLMVMCPVLKSCNNQSKAQYCPDFLNILEGLHSKG